ncbi:hypothetical protein ACN42_g5902 [Penicillium freii]|uniref:Uncharacterized protein n=1 Tax=Penicillium freii TaxID=48697 RepID=A0A101MIL0_PENFR|nr:hypothetical protein ACN42_g5902 [Penicillium freii]
MKGFIGGIPVALLAVAAQAKFAERQHEHDFHPQAGGTAIGGPSGNDNDGGFVSPYSASIKTDTKVNQWGKDDHSIKVKHTDVYPRPPVVPVPFGHPAGHGPQVPGMGPFGKRAAPGGTAIGGPSGNDEGQSFDMSVTGVFNTEVEDENKDDHSIDVKNKHVYPAPVDVHPHFSGPSRGGYNHPGAFGKRFGPHAGGTAIGGPSGNDGGQSFSAPTNIQTSADVNEHNEDDHSIGLKHEDIYAHPFAPFRRSENHGPAGHGGAPPPGHFEPHPESHFEPHPESHFEPHTESHYQPHSEPHYEPHPEPHFENHPEPHVEHHPEPHYEPHYSPTYAPHYEPHHTVEHELTSVKNNNNGPSAGSIAFGRRGFPGRPESHFEPHPENHFEPHPESHFAPHTESHYEPHSEPHYAPHPEPHFENHPEPHTENHPEPHYAPHYSPTYAPHYEPHTTLEHDVTSLKNNNNGPAAGTITFGRRGFPAGPESHFEPHPENHFEPHPESHYEPHTKSHYEPHSEPHYEPHPEPHFENHPEPHTENHPEPHYAPHYSPSYKPHYEPHTTLDYELTELKNNNNGPSAGSIAFGRRAYAPTPETSVAGGTAIGGPSGNDGGSSFSTPTDIDVDSDVDEHNEDNHAIKGDFTHVHPGASPEYAREEQVETPQCAAKVHEVVHTVTKTQYKTAEATHVAYQSAPAPAADNSRVPDYAPHDPAGADAYALHDPSGADGYAPHDPSGADGYAPHGPVGADAYAPSGPAPSSPADEYPAYALPTTDNLIPAHVPMAAPTPGPSAGYSGWAQPSGGAVPYSGYPQKSTGADPYASFPQPSTGADPYGSIPKYSVGANPYPASAPAPSDYAAQRPAYSKIAVHVPMATPASFGAFSQATPSNSMGKMIPTGASAEQKASPSSSASASVSHGIMFEGGAARLSGGIASAAAAVMGVLAFIL